MSTKKKSSKKKNKALSPQLRVLLVGLLSVVIWMIGNFAFKGWVYLSDNKLSNFTSKVDFYVYPDMTADQVIEQISLQTKVKRPASLARAFRNHHVDELMKPGHYVLRPEQTSAYAARMINNRWQTPVKVTLSGTMRLKNEIARKISNQLLIDSASVHRALNDEKLLAKYGFKPSTVFALIIPDTYEMYWTESMEEFLDRQKKAYDAFWTEERVAKARKQGLTKLQASIVASIVKGESNYEAEFPKIAGVYLNRLHKGMKLQADPTVAFCYDYKVNRILNKMLEFDSPYNTYKHAGLPPGPIYVPTKACLEAVLNPETSQGYLYFCADPSFNGSHRFAVSYTDHLHNARAFQAALNARGKK